MIAVPLLVYRDCDCKLWGKFRFIQLPSPGGRINITDHRDRVQRLRVMYIAHEPLHVDVADPGDVEPAWVHAEWIEDFY